MPCYTNALFSQRCWWSVMKLLLSFRHVSKVYLPQSICCFRQQSVWWLCSERGLVFWTEPNCGEQVLTGTKHNLADVEVDQWQPTKFSLSELLGERDSWRACWLVSLWGEPFAVLWRAWSLLSAKAPSPSVWVTCWLSQHERNLLFQEFHPIHQIQKNHHKYSLLCIWSFWSLPLS